MHAHSDPSGSLKTAKTFLVGAIAILCAIGGAPAHGADTAASDFMLRASPAPAPGGGVQKGDEKFVTMFTPAARWNRTYHWRYNHSSAPMALAGDKAGVIAQLQASLNKWTAACNVAAQYDGETSSPPNRLVNDPTYGQVPDGENVVGWGALDPSLGGWTYDWYSSDGANRVMTDADTVLNVADIGSMAELDRLMTHEWGHALGLAHSNVDAAIMAGPPYTQYNQLVALQPDDVRGCRCLYGLPAGVQAAYACSLPRQVDFGNAPIGATSAPQTITITNNGNAPLSIETVSLTNAMYKRVAGCDPGSVVAPGASCAMQVTVNPGAIGAVSSKLQLFTNDSFYEVSLVSNGVMASAPASSGTPIAVTSNTVDVVEYYNATLDHYFITYNAAEMANLDAGLTPSRWTRTGLSFKAYLTAQSGTSQVCRFYIPPADGNSHFFGRSAAECAATQQAHPDFVLEDMNFMQLYVPSGGVCPSGTQPIYRVFNNRADANHRYTTDRAVRDQMVGKGWIAEGDGADLVVMCAPQ